MMNFHDSVLYIHRFRVLNYKFVVLILGHVYLSFLIYLAR